MRSPDTSALQASQQWLPTGQATRVLGVSADTLKRYAMRDEFLIDGKHWRRGPHRNSPMVWNIPACQEAIRWRGRGKKHSQAM